MSDNIDKTSNPSLKTSEKPRLDLSTVLSELETNQAVGNDKITGNDKSIFSDFKVCYSSSFAVHVSNSSS
jgi:hypothetical protein